MSPSAPPGIIHLDTLADELLASAREARSGRAGHPLRGVPARADGTSEPRGQLTQIVLALTEGARLSEHENPGEATLLGLRGSVRLSTAEQSFEPAAGDLLVIPQECHDLLALTDAVVVLTLVSRARGTEAAR